MGVFTAVEEHARCKVVQAKLLMGDYLNVCLRSDPSADAVLHDVAIERKTIGNYTVLLCSVLYYSILDFTLLDCTILYHDVRQQYSVI